MTDRLTEEKQIGAFASLKDKSEAIPGAFANYNCLMAHMIAVTKLKAYEDAEEQGRLVVLPCKVGSPIYILRGDVNNGWETVKKTHVEKVSGGFSIGMLDRNTLKMYDFYYLTREEAEAALKRTEGNE